MTKFTLFTGIMTALCSAQMAGATDWHWDADGDASATIGGTGTWTLPGLQWRNGTATGPLTAYNDLAGPQSDTAANLVLGGVDAGVLTATASAVYNFNKITANATTTLATATAVGTFVGTTPTINVAASKQLTWGIDLSAPSATISKTGTGTWQVNNIAAQIVSNGTTLDLQQGTLQFNTSAATANLATGTGAVINAASGTTVSLVQTNNGNYTSAKVWTLGSKVILNGASLNGGSSNGGQFQRLASTTALQVDGPSTISQSSGGFSQNFTVESPITGAGNLTLTRIAANNRYLNLKGSMAGYSGNVTVPASTATGYVVLGNSTGWGSGSLSLTGAGSRVVLGDEAATVYNAAWTGGTALAFTSGTLAPAGAITLGAGAELDVYNNTAASAILLEPHGNVSINGGTLGSIGTAGTSAFVPFGGSTWTFGGTAASTVSGTVQFNNPAVTMQVADSIAGSAVDANFSGIISGSEGFTKTGAGTLKLGGISPLAGGTIGVNAGTLNVSGELGTASVAVADGAGMAGEGIIGGSLTLGAATGGSLEILTSTDAALKVKGDLILNGITTVNLVTGGNLTGIKVLDYDGTLTGSGASFVLGAAANYRAGSGVFNTSVPHTITVDIIGKNLVWKGAVDNKWDLQATANWIDDVPSAQTFFQADTVIFDDTPSLDQSISVATDVSPSLILAASSINYTLQTPAGGGKITGATSLLKDGTGYFSLLSANAFTGGTVISNGEVRIGNAASLGTGSVKVGDSASVSGNPSIYLDTARTVFANPVVISNQTSGVATLGSHVIAGTGDNNSFQNITLQRDVVFDSNAADRTDYRNISGTGNITVTGAGRTIFSSVNTFVGNLTVATSGSAAWLQPFTANSIPDTTNITINAGANLKFGTSEAFNGLFGAGDLWLNTGTAATYTTTVGAAGGNGSFSGIIKNNGTQIFALTKAGAGTQQLTGIASTYTGATILSGGKLSVTKLADGGAASSIGASTNAAASLIFNGGTLTYEGAGDTTNRLFQIGTANTTTVVTAVLEHNGPGSLELTNNTPLGFGTFTGPRALKLAGSSSEVAYFQPVLTNNSNGGALLTLEKAGTGTWILGSDNTYTGATTVSAGTLVVNGALASAVTVSAGATLGGVGNLSGAVSIPENAALSPGDSPPAIGTLTVASATIEGALKIQYDGAALTATDAVTSLGTLTLSGYVDFDAIGAPLTADSYVIATYGSLIGTFATTIDLPPNYTINYAFNGNHIALVKSAGTAYDSWIASFTSLTDPADKLKSADPDHDGLNNLGEFALDGDPTSAVANGKIAASLATIGEDQFLSYTIPVRTGAIADLNDAANGPLGLTASGLIYTIQGSDALAAWTLDVTEIVPALSALMPMLDDGWEYRTFKCPNPISTSNPSDFMRTVISEP